MPNNSVFCHGVQGPGSHVSKYSFSWLAENYYEETKQSTIQPRILWNSDIYKNANIASAKWDTFVNSDDELKTFLHNYLLYGIAFVDDVPATVEATEAVCQRVSIIRYLYFLFFSLRENHTNSIFRFICLHSVGIFIDICEDSCPLSPHLLVFCVTSPQVRRHMEKCGVLRQIVPEETLHTHL